MIEEIGFLSYSNRHADLLFELINRNHEQKSTLVTTNKSFAEWPEVFANVACVVSLIFPGSSTQLTHAALDRYQKWAKSYRYALKMDNARC